MVVPACFQSIEYSTRLRVGCSRACQPDVWDESPSSSRQDAGDSPQSTDVCPAAALHCSACASYAARLHCNTSSKAAVHRQLMLMIRSQKLQLSWLSLEW